MIIPLTKVREALLYPKPPEHATTFDRFLHEHGHLLYHIYMLNPLVTVFQQFRHAMVTHATISAGEALGSWAGLLEPDRRGRRDLRARLLGVQPLGPVRRREPLGQGNRRGRFGDAPLQAHDRRLR